MVYRELKQLSDDGYSARKIGYILAKAVIDTRNSKYLSAVDTIDAKVRNGIPEAKAQKAEKNVKGHFLVCLSQKILMLALEYKRGKVDADGLTGDVLDINASRRDSVEYALFEGVDHARSTASYLTGVGRRALEQLGNYHGMLETRRMKNATEPKQRKKTKNGKRKAKKRPNHMIRRQEIYDILRKVFTG